nr:hypothetical protein [Prevotella sp.]
MEYNKRNITEENSNLQNRIKEKDAIIAQLNKQISEYKEIFDMSKVIDGKLQSTDICQKLHYIAFHIAKQKPTKTDWNNLKKSFSKLFPKFREILYTKYYLNDFEYHTSLLIRLNFKPSEIALLQNCSLSEITIIRKRLLYRVFGKAGGKAKDYDILVKQIIP